MYDMVFGRFGLKYNVSFYDPAVSETKPETPYAILHICYPEHPGFVKTTLDYIQEYRPKAVIIHSTLAPGTCYAIQEELPNIHNSIMPLDRMTDPPVVATRVYYSPVRGNMKDGMALGLEEYTKYIATPENIDLHSSFDGKIEEYLIKSGFAVKWAKNAETLEYAKSLDLILYGVNIAFAQILERVVEFNELNYSDIADFIGTTETESDGKVKRDLKYGGYIGGHCVMQAVDRLSYWLARMDPSAKAMLEAIRLSNSMRLVELSMKKTPPAHHPKS